MSLEAVIAENTATMRELIAALAHTQVRPATTQEVGDTTVTSIKTPEITVQPARMPEPALVKVEPDPAPQAEAAQLIDYETLKKAFLAMVKEKGNECAPTLLAQFGVDNLKKVPPEKYSEVLAAIKKRVAA